VIASSMPVAKVSTSISISSRTSSRIGAVRYSKMRVLIDGRVVVIDMLVIRKQDWRGRLIGWPIHNSRIRVDLCSDKQVVRDGTVNTCSSRGLSKKLR